MVAREDEGFRPDFDPGWQYGWPWEAPGVAPQVQPGMAVVAVRPGWLFGLIMALIAGCLLVCAAALALGAACSWLPAVLPMIIGAGALAWLLLSWQESAPWQSGLLAAFLVGLGLSVGAGLAEWVAAPYGTLCAHAALVSLLMPGLGGLVAGAAGARARGRLGGAALGLLALLVAGAAALGAAAALHLGGPALAIGIGLGLAYVLVLQRECGRRLRSTDLDDSSLQAAVIHGLLNTLACNVFRAEAQMGDGLGWIGDTFDALDHLFSILEILRSILQLFE